MFTYTLMLRFAKASGGIDLTSNRRYLKFIKRCAAEYNEKSNGKTIEIVDSSLTSRSFTINLSSPFELDIPGRSLRLFTQALVEDEEFKKMVFNKKLFLTEPVINADGTTIDPNEIDDGEFIKALIDYVLNKAPGSSTEYKRKRKAFNRMKIIAKEEGIL